ncbi:hypothetical protein [Streptacidiphilus sp. MAP12-16]|uniref:hypothetical protein n=1 Tax=Streptacidiphilus sp. MAP12-16 TaxID=3156300 RepID=UPI00351342E3
MTRADATLRALRTHLGWICFATGALLCALGWYGVSGERYSARQIPYLASATAPGTALLVGGLVLLAARRGTAEPNPEQERMQRQIAVLYQLLTETDEAQAARQPTAAEGTVSGAPGAAGGTEGTGGTGGTGAFGETRGIGSGGRSSVPSREALLTIPGGGMYHRAGCLLVQGRTDAEEVAPATATARGLRPCPLCDPPEV